MNNKTLKILLIEDSPDYAELVQQWLSAAADQAAFDLIWTDSLSAGLNRLSQGGVDVILLDLGLPDSDGVDTYLATRANAPSIPVIVLSAGDSESLALRMIQEGAEDYLVKSSCNPELLVRAVRYAVVRRRSQVGRGRAGASAEIARVIGVLGAKGGVGTTSVACFLAAELRRQTAQKVLLADLDVQAGMASFLMAVEPKYSMLDATRNLDRLDRSCWDGIVTRSSSDFDIIASPCLLGGGELDPDSLRQVFTLVRSFYRWIVADLGRVSVVSTTLADRVDELFIITSTSIPSLYQAKRAVDAFVRTGMERDRLRLIVNQAEEGQALSGSELNTIFGIPVYARLSHDPQQLHKACAERRLPDHNSNIGKQIVELGRKVAGIKARKSKKGLPEFFSFVERFRKNEERAPNQHAG
jgi:Flp pilus assembly CpaE family ATPase